jgi:hypothetical protein
LGDADHATDFAAWLAENRRIHAEGGAVEAAAAERIAVG